MNKKRYFIPLLLVPIFSVSTLTSCNWFESTEEVKEIKRQKADNMQYISERTFSLKFTNGSKFLLGTGWIFAKENDTTKPDNYYDDIYYIATNLHVAAAIQNRNIKQYNFVSNKGYFQDDEPNTNYNKLYLGAVSLDGETIGTNYTLESNSNTYYNSYFDLTDDSKFINERNDYPAVSIAYTPIDLFSNMQVKDLAWVYTREILNNATMDLAILRIDFSKIQTIKNNKLVEQVLDSYNKKPTKFNVNYKANDPLTIAGFPLINENNYQAGKWSGIYNAEWYKPTYEDNNVTTGYKKSIGNLRNSQWGNGIKESDRYGDNLIEKVIPEYVIKDHIGFDFNGYACYRNIAKQALFKNVLLTGGSSGSMAINSNNEIVGIYWGSYSNNSLIKEKNIGAVDLFVNNNDVPYKYVDGNQNKTETILKPYNIFDDFVSYFPNTNLVNNIIK